MTNTLPKRGILYMVWGGPEHRIQLNESVDSVRNQYPDMPICICDLDQQFPNTKPRLGIKSWMYDISPFEETLFLDTDTKVLGDLSFGFDKAKQYGMAVAIDHACYARRWHEVRKLVPTEIHQDIVEYNTGVIFFNKQVKVKAVFDQWKSWEHISWNDQPGFAVAIEKANFCPFVLPDHIWNYRVYNADRLFGPIKIWHTEKPNHLTETIKQAITQEHNWRMYQVPELQAQHPEDRETILKC